MKNIRVFYLKIFNFLVVKVSIYLNRRVFVMNGPNTNGTFTMPDSNLLIDQENIYVGMIFFANFLSLS